MLLLVMPQSLIPTLRHPLPPELPMSFLLSTLHLR
jgi:hypothetical protein